MPETAVFALQPVTAAYKKPNARCAKRVADGKRSSPGIQPVHVYFADFGGKAELFAGKRVAVKSVQVRQDLPGKGFMEFENIDRRKSDVPVFLSSFGNA